ncbi:hypothetical protein [Pararhizobium sp.]|uniref:hypothetical protein n=1 Tax=Pararhizobium sp. TaxID=1977563 RepID=UPI003BAC37E3
MTRRQGSADWQEKTALEAEETDDQPYRNALKFVFRAFWLIKAKTYRWDVQRL